MPDLVRWRDPAGPAVDGVASAHISRGSIDRRSPAQERDGRPDQLVVHGPWQSPPPVQFAHRPHGAGSGSSSSRMRNAIRQPSWRMYARICSSSARRAAMTRAIRSSSGSQGSAVRDVSTAIARDRAIELEQLERLVDPAARSRLTDRSSLPIVIDWHRLERRQDLVHVDRSAGTRCPMKYSAISSSSRPDSRTPYASLDRAPRPADLLVVGDGRARAAGSG